MYILLFVFLHRCVTFINICIFLEKQSKWVMQDGTFLGVRLKNQYTQWKHYIIKVAFQNSINVYELYYLWSYIYIKCGFACIMYMYVNTMPDAVR